jgi:hypothetical protein
VASPIPGIDARAPLKRDQGPEAARAPNDA